MFAISGKSNFPHFPNSPRAGAIILMEFPRAGVESPNTPSNTSNTGWTDGETTNQFQA